MLAIVSLSLALLVPAGDCPGLALPGAGEIVRGFAPIGRYAGHWGIDIAAAPGNPVTAADNGVVTFAGDVAGVLSVTVHHGGGLRTSYSYLESIGVAVGQPVGRGSTLGLSGVDHENPAIHFSVRVGDQYQDPGVWLGCFAAPSPGLSLVPVPGAYPAQRATRHPRRDIRPTPSRSPVRR